MPLTDLERELLDFAGLYFRYAGAQEPESRHRFDRSSTMHWRKVNDLLDWPKALGSAPAGRAFDCQPGPRGSSGAGKRWPGRPLAR